MSFPSMRGAAALSHSWNPTAPYLHLHAIKAQPVGGEKTVAAQAQHKHQEEGWEPQYAKSTGIRAPRHARWITLSPYQR